jgi:hypothetical protein
LAPTVELLAHLCGSAAAGLRPAVRSVQKLELKEPSAQQREGVSKKRERCTMRLVAAHRTPLAESDGRAPSSSETRLRGKFFMLRDPVKAHRPSRLQLYGSGKRLHILFQYLLAQIISIYIPILAVPGCPYQPQSPARPAETDKTARTDKTVHIGSTPPWEPHQLRLVHYIERSFC